MRLIACLGIGGWIATAVALSACVGFAWAAAHDDGSAKSMRRMTTYAVVVLVFAWTLVGTRAFAQPPVSPTSTTSAPYDPCPSCKAVWPDWWCSFWWGC